MSVDVLVYAYLFICFSLIIFNIYTAVVAQKRQQGAADKDSPVKKEVSRMITLMEQGEQVTDQHLEWMEKECLSSPELVELDVILKKNQEVRPEATRKYIEALHPYFDFLCIEYLKKENMCQAHLLHILDEYKVVPTDALSTITDFACQMIDSDNMYCRENALRFFYGGTSIEALVRALLLLDKSDHYHYPKLITDGILTFRGDLQALLKKLWKMRSSFSVEMQLCIMNAIRFGRITMDEEMYGVLMNPEEDDELRFSAIRYFGNHVYDPAYDILINYLEHSRQNRWEYAAIAATAMGKYHSQRTVQALKKCLSNSNWYIRFNATMALRAFKLSYQDLADILDGNDRYAREILEYQRDREELERKTKEEKANA